MRMSAARGFWKISLEGLLLIFATLVPCVVTSYIAYDVLARGPFPAKRIELTQLQAINPLSDLSALGERATLSLQVENQTIDDLLISQAYLQNVGDAPIVESDYHENISVTVNEPWKIVAVENPHSWYVQLRWKRISNTKWEAEPALLNPGDHVAAVIYLTNTQPGGSSGSGEADKPSVHWAARIVNLAAFERAPDIFGRNRHSGIVVNLFGWGLPFTVVVALLFQALYLRLMIDAKLFRNSAWRSICLGLLASLLSWTAAECSATYLFGGDVITDLFGVNHWLNAPPIAAHLLAIIGLLYLRRRTRAARRL